MALRLSVLFLVAIAVAVFMQVAFYSSSQISCESDTVSKKFAECFCISNPQKLRAYNETADLRFYGWAQFFVLLQAIILYIPYHIGKKMDKAKQTELSLPSQYVLEIPVIMSLVGVIWMSDKILGGNFILFGVNLVRQVVSREIPPPPPPRTEIFPLMARCQVESFGTNATYDATCFLPMNELNSYAFVVLWTVYFLSLVLSLCNLSYVVFKIVQGTLNKKVAAPVETDGLSKELLEEEAESNFQYCRGLNLIVKPVRFQSV